MHRSGFKLSREGGIDEDPLRFEVARAAQKTCDTGSIRPSCPHEPSIALFGCLFLIWHLRRCGPRRLNGMRKGDLDTTRRRCIDRGQRRGTSLAPFGRRVGRRCGKQRHAIGGARRGSVSELSRFTLRSHREAGGLFERCHPQAIVDHAMGRAEGRGRRLASARTASTHEHLVGELQLHVLDCETWRRARFARAFVWSARRSQTLM